MENVPDSVVVVVVAVIVAATTAATAAIVFDHKCVSLFSRTQKVNDPCGQHIYIQEQCSTFDIDKDK